VDPLNAAFSQGDADDVDGWELERLRAAMRATRRESMTDMRDDARHSTARDAFDSLAEALQVRERKKERNNLLVVWTWRHCR
jgi:hypothetical protein